MVVIFLDSSSSYLSIGLARAGVLFDVFHQPAWQHQSEMMVDEIDKMLKRNNLGREDLSSVAVGIGPGSYTGVRIALTVAKVMAVALKIPLVPLSSLHILADENRPSICLINARSQRSYFGVYRGFAAEIDDVILTNDEVKTFIDEHPEYIVCGEAKQLGLEDNIVNPLPHMLRLFATAPAAENPLNVNPRYLKEL